MDPQVRLERPSPALQARAGCSSRGSSWSIGARSRGLDYRFANPDDGPAFFSLCVVALPLIFIVVWLEVAFSPPFWVHLLTSFPLMAAGCSLPLRPIKGWLVASQYVNKARRPAPRAVVEAARQGRAAGLILLRCRPVGRGPSTRAGSNPP